MYHPQPKCCVENGDHWKFYWDVLGVSGVHTDAGYIFRPQHPMAFDRHEEKPDQNSSHNAAGGHKEQPRRGLSLREQPLEENQREKVVEVECVCVRVCVCVCVCVWGREMD